MKKKIIICLSTAIFVIVLTLSLTIKKDTISNNVTYAINLVDTSGKVTRVTSFPSKGAYKVTVGCSNGKWLYDEWKLQISGKNLNASCRLTFTAISKTTLANKVISLNGTTQGTGQIVKEPSTDYRYEGKNPNNYVWFNNELWRIIGVFGSNTHGQSGNLVKIIKDESIGTLAWDGLGTNQWATSSTTAKASLNAYLNNYYYNNTDPSGYTIATPIYKFPNKEKGIKDNYRGMIQQVTWKLGGRADNNATAATFYNSERGTTVPSGASSTYIGYVGLMYPSDYGYGVLSSSCGRSTLLSSYYTSACFGQNWLYNLNDEWLLTPKSNYNYIPFSILNDGRISTNGAAGGLPVRPALYLKSSVYVVDGDGSISNPYIIMN